MIIITATPYRPDRNTAALTDDTSLASAWGWTICPVTTTRTRYFYSLPPPSETVPSLHFPAIISPLPGYFTTVVDRNSKFFLHTPQRTTYAFLETYWWRLSWKCTSNTINMAIERDGPWEYIVSDEKWKGSMVT